MAHLRHRPQPREGTAMIAAFFESLMEQPFASKVIYILIGNSLVVCVALAGYTGLAAKVRANDIEQLQAQIAVVQHSTKTDMENINKLFELQVQRIIERIDKLETNVTHRIDRLEDTK